MITEGEFSVVPITPKKLRSLNSIAPKLSRDTFIILEAIFASKVFNI